MENSRFSLVEVDDIPQAPIVPPAPAVTTGDRAEPKGASLADVDLEARARCVAADDLAQKHGLAFDEPTFFAWGTKGQWGSNAQCARAELAAQPLLGNLVSEAGSLIASEKRLGSVVALSKIAYGTDDRIRTKSGSEGATCSPQALKQLVSRAGGAGGSYLCHPALPGSLRAPHVQHWIDRAVRENPEQQVKILSKVDSKNGQRGVYAAVGKNFPLYGMDEVIRDVADLFPSEARGSLFYDESSTRWRVDAAIGAEFEPVVGDVHRIGVRFGAHDAGGGSYWADTYAIRVRCVNFTLLRTERSLGRVRHIGSVSSLRDRIKSIIEVGAEAQRDFSNLWREANESAIVEGVAGDARDVFRALIRAGYVSAPESEDAAVERYFDAWLKEPGANRSDYVNAVTRAAHEAPWSSPWVTEELEAQASNLLYNRVVLTEKQLGA